MVKTLTLIKQNRETYHFNYEVGQESLVLETLIEMVNNRDLSFDWFDAAILSHQVGQNLAQKMKGCLGGNHG